jgi:hypothetical protein
MRRPRGQKNNCYFISTLLKTLLLFAGNLELSQTLNNQLLAGAAAVDIPHVVGRALEVGAGVVALGDEDVVLGAVCEGLVEGDWWALYKY